MENQSNGHQLFGGRSLVIATRHQKEKVIAPLLEDALGVKCFTIADLNTDLLGTFSGEVALVYILQFLDYRVKFVIHQQNQLKRSNINVKSVTFRNCESKKELHQKTRCFAICAILNF